jgi:hypothetical protein
VRPLSAGRQPIICERSVKAARPSSGASRHLLPEGEGNGVL